MTMGSNGKSKTSHDLGKWLFHHSITNFNSTNNFKTSLVSTYTFTSILICHFPASFTAFAIFLGVATAAISTWLVTGCLETTIWNQCIPACNYHYLVNVLQQYHRKKKVSLMESLCITKEKKTLNCFPVRFLPYFAQSSSHKNPAIIPIVLQQTHVLITNLFFLCLNPFQIFKQLPY